MSLKIVVLAKQVPDTRNVGKDAMNADGSNYNTKPGKSYKLEYSATFNYSDGRSETITSTTTH